MQILNNAVKLLFIVAILSAASFTLAADLINTGFEDADGWANHVTGIWTQVAGDGTWSANAYANAGSAHGGTRKVGFNLAARFLSAPSKNKPGVLTFWATKSGSGSNWTVDMDKQINGGGWTNLTSFSASDIPWNVSDILSYIQFTVNINDSSNNVEIRWYMSARSAGSCYIDDVVLTEYSPPSAANATISPSSFTFGAIAQGSTIDKEFIIEADDTNTTDVEISSPGFIFTGDDSAKFSLVSGAFPLYLTHGTSTTLTIRYTPGSVNHADHNATATLSCNDPEPPIALLKGLTYWDVANIAELRTAPYSGPSSGTLRITNPVVVTVATNGLNAARYQFFIQDNSGADGKSAILVDDAAFHAGNSYNIGDGIAANGAIGTITSYNSMLEFCPTTAWPAGTPGTAPSPLDLSSAITDFETIEAELVRIDVADVAETGNWSKGTTGTNYTLTAPTDVVIKILRVEDNSQLDGDAIPPGKFDVIGIAFQNAGNYQIQPRLHSDIITPATIVPDWKLIR